MVVIVRQYQPAGWIVAVFAAGIGAACAADDRATSQADDASGAPAKVQPTTRPSEAPQLSSGDPAVDAILDRLEAKGQAIKGLRCALTYRYVIVDPVEDAQTKEGELLFVRDEPNPKFLIHFNKIIADGIVSRRGEYFLFDGQWLTERHDKARTIQRRQIVREGERIDAFKLGTGPFPLPFGQKREAILESFTVKAVKFELGDPRNSQHLRCVPRPATELARKYSRVDFYIDKRIDLPVRIVMVRNSDGNRIEVDFKQIDTDEAPAQSRFKIEVPDGFTEAPPEFLPPLPKREAGPRG